MVLFLPAVLDGGELTVLLGCGAKLGLQLWEVAAARAEDVCSLHVLTSRRGAVEFGSGFVGQVCIIQLYWLQLLV